jgi:hypothetical protein
MTHREHPETIDPTRAAVYVPAVLEAMPRLLGGLDREPDSISHGNWDRTHWGWKFCDFPIMMSQISAYPLALLWRYPFAGNPYFQNARTLEWIEGAVKYVCSRQHRNGSFDSVAPFIQDHGNTLFMIYLMTEVRRLLGSSMSAGLEAEISRAVAAAGEFALRSNEDYAFINNHQALYAVAFLNAAELTGDLRFARRAEQNIDTIIRKQSPEGWYEEYGGPDPGYESLGIFYLATYWRRTGNPRLLESLRRSVEFFSHFVHPDGSVGGVYGSRHTALYMPGGLELLAAEIPMAAAVARFLRERLSRGNLVTPASTDSQNLGVIVYTYLEGCFAEPVKGASVLLPCESLIGVKRFPHAGLAAAGTAAYFAVANCSKGGVCRVFERPGDRIRHEDAGYIAEIGKQRYTSGLRGMSHAIAETAGNEVGSDATFGEIRQELPTAAKWIVLRLLNLTLFRSLVLGAWVRRRILARLILGRRKGPLRLTRSITFGEGEIRFRDRLTIDGPAPVKSLTLARSFTPIHMGSAKYFHASELEDVTLPRLDGTVERLNQSRELTHEFTLRFPLSGQDRTIDMEVSSRS